MIARLLLLAAVLFLAGCPSRVGFASYDGHAADLRTNLLHCCGCHRACPTGASCVQGECRPAEWLDAVEFESRAGAIQAAYDLLLARGIEQGFSWDGADAVDVTFPDGAPGSLVALGFSGPARGYLVLFRIEENHAVPLQVEEGPIVWGVRSLRTDPLEPIDLEVLRPLADPSGRGSIVAARGAGHAGTGHWIDEWVQWVEILPDGLEPVYTGIDVAAVCADECSEEHCRREILDLDGDGTVEIVESCRECVLSPDAAGEYRESECGDEQRLEYHWDGRSWQ